MTNQELKSLAGLSILVVEDDFVVGDALSWCLTSFGADDVELTPSVNATMLLLDRRRFDVAILDVNLGDETASPIAARLERDHVPFLFVTGYDEDDELLERFTYTPRLRKPVPPELLLDTLHSLIGSEDRNE